MEITAKATLERTNQKREAVGIIGFGSGMELMRDLDPSIPIWSMNAAEDYDFHRLDALFEMHPVKDIILETHRIKNLKQEHPYPIFMLEKYPWFPASVEYPKEAVLDSVFENIFIGDEHAEYIDASLPYMIALAVLYGFKKAYVYGFGLTTDTEYAYQRPGAALLIGWAAGKGTEIMLPKDTNLLPNTLYGYEDYQSISRQNCEQWLQDLQVQESDWMGKLNLFHERVLMIEKLDGPAEDLAKAREDRNNAYQQMYMRQGAVHLLMQQIQVMDRKRDAMSEFLFEDHFFIMEETEEKRTADK